ncbi:MAG TPA: lysozyme [Propionibacteriaceae bacterium]
MTALLRGGLVALSALMSAALSLTGTTAAHGAEPAPTPVNSAPAVGAQSYPVLQDLDGRTARTLSNRAVPNKYPAGSSVLVVCQANGQPTYGGSTIWDLTSDGLWVPDYFVSTGSVDFAPDLERCTLPKSYVATDDLDGRTTKDIGERTHPNRYRRGSTVEVVCQAYGGATYEGHYLWDRTVDGLWVPDHYVKTGTSGRASGLPRCDADSAGGESTRRLRPADLQFSNKGAEFIAAYEGFRSTVYNDAGGHCTIGYGHLLHRGGCTAGDGAQWGSLSRDRALALLWKDAETFADGVRAALADTPMHQHEFDALVSLSYNIGNGGFRRSSVRDDLAAGAPAYAAVPDHLLKWVTSSGKRLAGLERRRMNEGLLFRTGSYAITSVRSFSRG